MIMRVFALRLTWLGIGDARGRLAEKHIRRSTLSRFKGLTKGEGTPELLHVLHMPHATSPTHLVDFTMCIMPLSPDRINPTQSERFYQLHTSYKHS